MRKGFFGATGFASQLGIPRTIFLRSISLALGFLLNLCVIRLTIHLGSPRYYSLIVLISTLPSLFPMSDFGLGTTLINKIAASQEAELDLESRRTVSATLKALIFSSVCLLIFLQPLLNSGIGMKFLNPIAREFPQVRSVVVIIFWLFLFGSPLSIGYRLLVAKGKNELVVLFGIVNLLASSTFIAISAFLKIPIIYFALYLSIGSLFSAFISFIVGMRKCNIKVIEILKLKTKIKDYLEVLSQALPMLIIAIGLNLGLQLDKYILNSVSSSAELAQYILGFQIYLPVWSILTTVAVALWPNFRFLDRNNQMDLKEIYLRIKWFSLGGVLTGLGFVILSPVVADIFTDGSITLGLNLRLYFWLLIIIQSFQLPVGYYLMGRKDLLFQAAMVSIMALANVLLTIDLAARLGAIGPLIASAITITLIQIIPSLFYIQAKHKVRRGLSIRTISKMESVD